MLIKEAREEEIERRADAWERGTWSGELAAMRVERERVFSRMLSNE